MLRLSRLPRIYKLAKVFRVIKFMKGGAFQKIILFLKLNDEYTQIMKFSVITLLLLHTTGCFWYFLSTMEQLLKTIMSEINYDSSQVFLDDCIPLYFKYLEQGNNPEEYDHLPKIQIFQIVNVFLSDFLFFFITNFCSYKGNIHSSDNKFHQFIHSSDNLFHQFIQ